MDDEGDRHPPLCPSTIRFLADQGLIDPSYAGFGVEDLLQHLQTGASDEPGVNDLTDIEVDENSVYEILEPKGVNPQQQVFSEQPDGPVALVEQSKALIARQLHPNENWLQDSPQRVLRFEGQDELVMTRAALRSTPAPGRKNTFKPLITRTNKSLAEEAMRSIKIPPDQKTADPPETVEPIDAHLKLGLTASRELFSKTQHLLTSVQELTKGDRSSSTPQELLVHECLKPARRSPTPVLLPRVPRNMPEMHDMGISMNLDIAKSLKDSLSVPDTPSSHSMSQLMDVIDDWAGDSVPSFSPFGILPVSSKPTSPLTEGAFISPKAACKEDSLKETPLLPRSVTLQPVKRALSPASGKAWEASKKLKSFAPNVSRRSSPASSDSGITVVQQQGEDVTAPDSAHWPRTNEDGPVPRSPSSRDTLSVSRVSQKLEDTPLPSLECAGLSLTSMTLAQYEQLHDSGNTDEDEVDELASSVDDIESFYRLADSPDLSIPAPSRSGTPILDPTSPVAGKTVELDAGPSMAPIKHDERKSPDASDGVVYTPPAEAEEDRKWSTAAIASLEENAATEAGDKKRATEVQEKKAESDFFMEERVKLLEGTDKQTLLSTSVKASTTIPATKKPRFPLTQLSTESLALAAFKRKTKVHRAPSPGPSCFASGLGAIDRQPKDFSNVNGYLLLRSRNDLLRTPEPKQQSRSKLPSATPKKEVTKKSTSMSPAGKMGAEADANLSKSVTSDTVASDAIPAKQAPTASTASHLPPVQSLEHLKPVKCFGSFRLLQNITVDRALDMLKIEIVYPEDADALSLRAAELSTANHQTIFPQIFQPDIILSPRSCLFYYRLSNIYKLATILDERFEEKRMHHSKVLLEAIKLLSNSYDKITLVFEVFESVGKDSGASAVASMPVDPFTPAIKRALDKLHTDIGSLMENMERAIGDELDIEILYARTQVEAASFARERLDVRYSDVVQLGSIGWDQRLYDLFGLNDLSAHHLVIGAGSLEAFQEMEEEERTYRFSELLGHARVAKINRIIRSQRAFGTVSGNVASEMQPNEQINKIPPQVAAKTSEKMEDPGYTDSYYSDPNLAYNYAPTTYSQASAVQQDDTFRCERPVDQGHSRIGYIHDTVTTSSPHPMPSSQSQMNPDDFDDLILDDEDVEAELAAESEPTRRPFTPAHEIGDFWPVQMQQYHCPSDLVYAQQVTHYNQDFAYMQRGQFNGPPDEYQRYGYESNTFEMDPETTEIF